MKNVWAPNIGCPPFLALVYCAAFFSVDITGRLRCIPPLWFHSIYIADTPCGQNINQISLMAAVLWQVELARLVEMFSWNRPPGSTFGSKWYCGTGGLQMEHNGPDSLKHNTPSYFNINTHLSTSLTRCQDCHREVHHAFNSFKNLVLQTDFTISKDQFKIHISIYFSSSRHLGQDGSILRSSTWPYGAFRVLHGLTAACYMWYTIRGSQSMYLFITAKSKVKHYWLCDTHKWWMTRPTLPMGDWVHVSIKPCHCFISPERKWGLFKWCPHQECLN